MTIKIILPHQWTHDVDKVLVIKCVSHDMKSYGGFQWPESGPVEAPDWNGKAECGGGLHGWAWGLSVGDGMSPDYQAKWLVFSADPRDVIDLGGKVKCKKADVIMCGTYLECYLRVLPGQIAWTQQRGAASATGLSGAASATGWRGAASATGESGAASATGLSGAASATGERGAASATGLSGAASATGLSGAASATGWSGAASATGWSGAASATGWRGAAVTTQDFSILECGSDGLCATTADTVFWIVRKSAILCQRTRKGAYLIFADDYKLEDGQKVLIEHGVVYIQW